MEPFGVFSLLKSMLTNPPSESKKREDSPPPSKAPSAEEPPLPPQEKPNACLGFFEAHDRRSKQTKGR